ncbi:MAG: putative capsular polysaccharide synthesis family protein [Cyanobacteria bacterium J06581_3]
MDYMSVREARDNLYRLVGWMKRQNKTSLSLSTESATGKKNINNEAICLVASQILTISRGANKNTASRTNSEKEDGKTTLGKTKDKLTIDKRKAPMKPKAIVQFLLKQSYYINYPCYRLYLSLQGQLSQDKIVIYQMAKVGSTTIWKSLEARSLDSPVYHVHTLKHQQISKAIKKDKANFPKQRFIYPETVHSEYLRRQLDKGIGTPWNVITLVRDPVAQRLSSFFQILEGEQRLGRDYMDKMEEAGESKVLQEIIARFYQKRVNNPKRKHPFEWFNKEFKHNLEFDIFSESAFAGENYRIYNTDMARILLLKLEALNDSHQSAFQEFLGIEKFSLVQANIGKTKRYRKLYKRFLREVNLPVEYLDKIYRTDLVRYFYTASEIEQFYQRWRTH